MKNTTGETLYNASYIRKFDPDQNPLNHATDNYFFKDGTGGIWAVASSTPIGAANPVAPENHKAALQQVQNPFIFCAKDVVDPEQLNVSINTSDAMTRNVIFGINLSFK